MTIGERVRRRRNEIKGPDGKSLTQVELVARIRRFGGKFSQPELSALERDEIGLPGCIFELAQALGMQPEDLTGKPIRRPKGQAQAAIRHFVGAGDEVHLFEGESDSEAVDYTDAPPGFEREKGSAVQVRGDSMRPIFEEGDLLFFRFRFDPPSPSDLPERPVIVQVKDGALYVKKLLPGTKRGRFHLLSINPLTRTLQDQEVESFAYIEWVKPRVS